MRGRRFPWSEALLREAFLEVVRKRDPNLLPSVVQAPLPADNASVNEHLRELVLAELVEEGLGPDDEPSDYGRRLEAVIDWLGRGQPPRIEPK